MISTYIDNLKIEYNKSYIELAEMLNISYPTLMRMKKNETNNISTTMVKKFASSLNEEPAKVLYDIIFKEYENSLLINHTKSSLLFLCNLYLNNYNISLGYNVSEKEGTPVLFEGMAYQKRAVNNYTLVDSWKTLKKEYSLSFNNEYQFSSIFKSNEAYCNCIYAYCIHKFLCNAYSKFRSYYIVFDNKDIDAYNFLKNNEINATGFQITPIYLESK